VWMGCPPNSREKRLLKALIQIANALLKAKMGRRNAARRLLEEAAELVGECRIGATEPELMGVDLRHLSRALAGTLVGSEPERSPDLLPDPVLVLQPLRGIAEGWTPAIEYAL
jgi:predicted metal-dependent hydrolase